MTTLGVLTLGAAMQGGHGRCLGRAAAVSRRERWDYRQETVVTWVERVIIRISTQAGGTQGAGTMPNAPKSDADCIEGAYEDAVGGLFKALFTNLESSAGTSTDQQYVAAFTKGLGTLKRAKTLALGVVGPAAPVAAAAVRRARKPRARRRK